MKLKTTLSIGAPFFAVLAFSSVAQALPYLDGAINMGIGSGGGGVVLLDAGGSITTDINTATGIQAWINAVVLSSTGSSAVTANSAVTFSAPWNFNDPKAPLWSVGGLSFDVTSTSVSIIDVPGFPSAPFLLVEGTGTLKKSGFADTPGTWAFATQGEAANLIFSWSSSAYPTSSVPDGGATVALLGFTLLGLHGVRQRLVKR